MPVSTVTSGFLLLMTDLTSLIMPCANAPCSRRRIFIPGDISMCYAILVQFYLLFDKTFWLSLDYVRICSPLIFWAGGNCLCEVI